MCVIIRKDVSRSRNYRVWHRILLEGVISFIAATTDRYLLYSSIHGVPGDWAGLSDNDVDAASFN